MGKQISVVKHENSVMPGFRNMISRAESTEDVKKFFVYSVRELLVNIFQDNRYKNFEGIKLSAGEKSHFECSNNLMNAGEFSEMWNNSDLPHVIGRMAETAVHRYRHLEKKPEKTTIKIRN